MITTKRLMLREMEEGDLEALFRVLGDKEIMCHYPYFFDEESVRGWIRRNQERYQIFGFGLWAVCLKDTGEMIGDCGLTMQIIDGQIKPEIGYHIHRDHQRRGYAAEAATAVRDWTFRHTPFQMVYSYMKTANEPSARTAMAYGCKQIGQFTDEEGDQTSVYAMSRDDWMNRK